LTCTANRFTGAGVSNPFTYRVRGWLADGSFPDLNLEVISSGKIIGTVRLGFYEPRDGFFWYRGPENALTGNFYTLEIARQRSGNSYAFFVDVVGTTVQTQKSGFCQ